MRDLAQTYIGRNDVHPHPRLIIPDYAELTFIVPLRTKQRECRELRRPGGVAYLLSIEAWAD
jgi:hypothetical protein